MLPCIANQKHAVGCVKAMKKLVHLLGTCKARFIDNKEPFLSIGPGRLTRVIIWVMILVIGAFAWWIYMQLAPMD